MTLNRSAIGLLALVVLPIGSPAAGQSAVPNQNPVMAAPSALIDLLPGPAAGRLDRVTVELEVGGHLLRPEDPADRTSPTAEAAMSVRGKLEYDERRLTETRSVRHYRRAEAKLITDEQTKTPELPADRRLIVADDQKHRIVLSAPGGPLTRDQHDLVDVIGATLGIDGLLPTAAVEQEGGEWKIDGPAMARLLGLADVGLCEVTAVVDDTNDRYARFQMAGAVHGTVDGAATEIDLRGVGLFSLEQKRLTQLNLAIREDRKVGPATPGFKGIAKSRIVIKPLNPSADEAPELIAERVRALAKRKIVAAAPLVTAAERQGFAVRHDQQWFATDEDRRSLVLRRVDGDDLAAQATFNVGDSSSEPSLPSFESRVRATVGAATSKIVSSEQWTNPAGCRCMGVVARGEVGGVPVEWRYYQVAGADGSPSRNRRITLAATIQPTADRRAGEATRGLIDSLTITPPKPVATANGETKPRR